MPAKSSDHRAKIAAQGKPFDTLLLQIKGTVRQNGFELVMILGQYVKISNVTSMFSDRVRIMGRSKFGRRGDGSLRGMLL